MGGNLSPSLVRTLIPLLFGGLLTHYGISPEDPGVAVLLTGVISYAYYAAVRFLEVFGGPKWGYILGVAKSPGYTPGSPVKHAPIGEPSVDGDTTPLI